MLINNSCIKEDIKDEINDNEGASYQNPWYTAKATLRGNLITIWTYIRKEEKDKIDTQNAYQTSE